MSDISRIAANAVKEAGLHTIKIKNRDQQEITYTIQLLGAKQSAVIAAEIFKLVGPALGAWYDSSAKKELILPEDDSMFTEVAMLLVNQMDKISVLDLIDILTRDVTCNGQKVDIDKEFRGNLAGLFALVKFSLQENIGNFSQWPELLGLKIPSTSDNKSREDTSN